MKKLVLRRNVRNLPVLLMLPGFGALMASTIAWQTGTTDFATKPPKVLRAWFQQLSKPTAQGNAKLFVRFQPDQRLGNAVTLQLPDASGNTVPVVLHDDGIAPDTKASDGVFTGITTINANDLALFNEAIQRGANQTAAPIFDQRQMVGQRTIKQIDVNGFNQLRPVSFFPANLSVFIDPDRSLLIHDASVINDPTRTYDPCTNTGTPGGAWTFGHLMTEMANQPLTGITPSNFVRQWLNNWLLTQTVNGDVVAARTAIQTDIITPWEIASGVGPGGPLDLKKAPFRLLAIVNRIDLKDNATYGGGNAGEGRFVFCATDPFCNALPFTVIFEYGINKKGCPAIQNWGQQWVNLQSFTLGSPAYNSALQAITDQFVLRNSDPTKPNGSALNQLRTDEIELDFANGWELREFHLSPNTNLLTANVVKQTPAWFANNMTSDIGNYVNPIAAAVVADNYTVPATFPGTSPFQGGKAPNHFDFWNDNGAPLITMPNARHHFSLNTCNGCHGRETNTGFTMVNPTSFPGTPSLAGFLTGITVSDPVTAVPRTFNDLARRQTILSNIVSTPCSFGPILELFFDPARSAE